MSDITANDLKTRGIAAIEASLADGRTEAVVSVRGTQRYVVMELAHYHHLRECELDAALAETRADMAAGRYVVESAQQHVARLQALLDAEASPVSAKPTTRATVTAAAVKKSQPASRKPALAAGKAARAKR